MMMIVVRTAISSTRAALSDKAHLAFFFCALFFRGQVPSEHSFPATVCKLSPLMIVAAFVTDIAAKRVSNLLIASANDWVRFI